MSLLLQKYKSCSLLQQPSLRFLHVCVPSSVLTFMSAASLYKKAVTPDIPGASLCHWYYPCDDILFCGFCLIMDYSSAEQMKFFLTCFSENWLSELFEKSIMTLKNKPFKDGWITKGFYLTYCNITLPPHKGKKKENQ